MVKGTETQSVSLRAAQEQQLDRKPRLLTISQLLTSSDFFHGRKGSRVARCPRPRRRPTRSQQPTRARNLRMDSQDTRVPAMGVLPPDRKSLDMRTSRSGRSIQHCCTLIENLKGTVSKGVGFTNRGKTVPALQDLLSKMLSMFRGRSKRVVVVILDALDACSEPEALVGRLSRRAAEGWSRAVRPGQMTDLLHGSQPMAKVAMRIEDDTLRYSSTPRRRPIPASCATRRDDPLHDADVQHVWTFGTVLLDKLGGSVSRRCRGPAGGSAARARPGGPGGRPRCRRPRPRPRLSDRAAWLGHHISLQLLLLDDDRSRPSRMPGSGGTCRGCPRSGRLPRGQRTASSWGAEVAGPAAAAVGFAA